ncbi:hypothetical protein VB620_06850 [Nodularia harveyana UHCC-0300]|uniref:BAR domain-containing protein n=1 Tax=Nodularia harveyana UHCC-0300 TaxID=2974287 RepID=A0ABU5UBZ7_9CYAN|nr:hypothetical protein [Nodularia harveyana]MEA5581057.1 hypothetical protein [Nodularia harveyana UHCC-0300]
MNISGAISMHRLADKDQIDQDVFTDLQKQVQQMTRTFINMCRSAYSAKLNSNRAELKAMQELFGWTGSTLNPYAKVGKYIAEIEISNLDLLDCNTIKALCYDKFQPILERLKSERLTVAEVRQEMAEINQEVKKDKPPQQILEWKKRKTGEHTLIICLQDVETAREFETRLKASQIPLPLFIRSLLKPEPEPVQSDITREPPREQPQVRPSRKTIQDVNFVF